MNYITINGVSWNFIYEEPTVGDTVLDTTMVWHTITIDDPVPSFPMIIRGDKI